MLQKIPPEHRLPFGGMTELEVEQLVQKVSKKVMENFYLEIGKSVAQKVIWVLGLATVAVVIWLSGVDKLKVFK